MFHTFLSCHERCSMGHIWYGWTICSTLPQSVPVCAHSSYLISSHTLLFSPACPHWGENSAYIIWRKVEAGGELVLWLIEIKKIFALVMSCLFRTLVTVVSCSADLLSRPSSWWNQSGLIVLLSEGKNSATSLFMGISLPTPTLNYYLSLVSSLHRRGCSPNRSFWQPSRKEEHVLRQLLGI